MMKMGDIVRLRRTVHPNMRAGMTAVVYCPGKRYNGKIVDIRIDNTIWSVKAEDIEHAE